MKILILILSFTDEPYLSLMRTQQSTFDSVDAEGVKTVYYYGGGKGWVNDKEFSADASDEYFYMTKKCILALDEVLKDYPATHVFRSNSSSYICKERLKEFAATLPTKKLYAGWTMTDTNYHSQAAVSGAGIWLSRDTAQILIDHCDTEIEKEEDIVIARCLHDNGIVAIEDQSRVDLINYPDLEDVPLDRYHYRAKSGDRLQDSENMKILHNKIINQ